MLLLGLLLLTSALAGRRQGAVAESDLSSKFAFSGAKEQNGKEAEPQRPPPRSPGQGGGGRPGGAERSGAELSSCPLSSRLLSSLPRAAPRRRGSAAPRVEGAGAAGLCPPAPGKRAALRRPRGEPGGSLLCGTRGAKRVPFPSTPSPC